MQIPNTYYNQHKSRYRKQAKKFPIRAAQANRLYEPAYRIGASRRIHVIKAISSLLGPVLDEVQVALGEIRVQHSYILEKHTSTTLVALLLPLPSMAKFYPPITRTARPYAKANQAFTLSSMTCMICRERRRSLSVSGLHLTATCK